MRYGYSITIWEISNNVIRIYCLFIVIFIFYKISLESLLLINDLLLIATWRFSVGIYCSFFLTSWFSVLLLSTALIFNYIIVSCYFQIFFILFLFLPHILFLFHPLYPFFLRFHCHPLSLLPWSVQPHYLDNIHIFILIPTYSHSIVT